MQRLRRLVFAALLQRQLTTAVARLLLAEAEIIARAPREGTLSLASIVRKVIEKPPPTLDNEE